MIPQRGGDWYDGGQPQGVCTSHFQSTSIETRRFRCFSGTWNNAFQCIAAANRLITTAGIAEVPEKVAELRKCFVHWYRLYLLDMFW